MRGRENIDRFGLYLSELICMKGKETSRTVFNKLLEEINQVIEKVDGPLTKGHMYSNLGSVFALLGHYKKSKSYYRKVFKYHKDPASKAVIYTNIGDVEKLSGSKEEALRNYSKAEKLLYTDDKFLKHVYDEYASYYLECGEIEKAEKYIDKIFSDEYWKISGSNHSFLLTFAHIKIALKKEYEIINVIKKLLNEIACGYIYTFKHLSLIDKIVMWKYGDDKLLNALNKEIISYYLNNDMEEEYKNILKRILGGIAVNLNQI